MKANEKEIRDYFSYGFTLSKGTEVTVGYTDNFQRAIKCLKDARKDYNQASEEWIIHLKEYHSYRRLIFEEVDS